MTAKINYLHNRICWWARKMNLQKRKKITSHFSQGLQMPLSSHLTMLRKIHKTHRKCIHNHDNLTMIQRLFYFSLSMPASQWQNTKYTITKMIIVNWLLQILLYCVRRSYWTTNNQCNNNNWLPMEKYQWYIQQMSIISELEIQHHCNRFIESIWLSTIILLLLLLFFVVILISFVLVLFSIHKCYAWAVCIHQRECWLMLPYQLCWFIQIHVGGLFVSENQKQHKIISLILTIQKPTKYWQKKSNEHWEKIKRTIQNKKVNAWNFVLRNTHSHECTWTVLIAFCCAASYTCTYSYIHTYGVYAHTYSNTPSAMNDEWYSSEANVCGCTCMCSVW